MSRIQQKINLKLKGYSFNGSYNSWVCYEFVCGCMLYEYKTGKIKFIGCKFPHKKLSDIIQFKVVSNEQMKTEIQN